MSPRLLALVPLAVGINLALGVAAAAAHLPVFLDTAGTVLTATLAGIPAAALVAALSQVALGASNAVWLWFLPVHLFVALAAGLAARAGAFRSPARAAGTGLLVGVAAASLSWPISYYAFGGVTGGGVTAVTTVLRGAGLPLPWAVFLSGLGADGLDKAVTFLLVRYLLSSLPRRAVTRFPRVARALDRP